MMGGGFGGCSINLVQMSRIEDFTLQVEKAYMKKFGQRPFVYQVYTEKGTSEILS